MKHPKKKRLTLKQLRAMRWRKLADLWLEIAEETLRHGPIADTVVKRVHRTDNIIQWDVITKTFNYGNTERALKATMVYAKKPAPCLFCMKVGNKGGWNNDICKKKCRVYDLCCVHQLAQQGCNKDAYRGFINACRVWFDKIFGRGDL